MSKKIKFSYEQIWNLPIKSYEKIVLLALRDFADQEDLTCFPSYQTIANKCGLSRRRVIDIVKILISSGLLDKEVLGKSNNLELHINGQSDRVGGEFNV